MDKAASAGQEAAVFHPNEPALTLPLNGNGDKIVILVESPSPRRSAACSYIGVALLLTPPLAFSSISA
jgi:hypothetical protein